MSHILFVGSMLCSGQHQECAACALRTNWRTGTSFSLHARPSLPNCPRNAPKSNAAGPCPSDWLIKAPSVCLKALTRRSRECLGARARGRSGRRRGGRRARFWRAILSACPAPAAVWSLSRDRSLQLHRGAPRGCRSARGRREAAPIAADEAPLPSPRTSGRRHRIPGRARRGRSPPARRQVGAFVEPEGEGMSRDVGGTQDLVEPIKRLRIETAETDLHARELHEADHHNECRALKCTAALHQDMGSTLFQFLHSMGVLNFRTCTVCMARTSTSSLPRTVLILTSVPAVQPHFRKT